MKPIGFMRFCGVKPHTFAKMVKALRRSERQKKKEGRDPDLSLEDQLLLTLQYCREYGAHFHPSVNRPGK